jgi:uncharacterized membrane protein YebE (DUF533 family)
MADSMMGSLTSGKGLITAIGLGIGAYEILRSKNSQGAVVPPQHGQPGTGQPGPSPASAAGPATPPPLPKTTVGQTEPSPTAVVPQLSTPEKKELALRLIQVMIGAAWADGAMDAEEEKQILNRLQGQGLDSEEKQYLLTELHNPRPIDQLCAGVTDPVIAQTMYSLAVSALVIDTDQERNWLDELAARLSISKEMQAFIEAEA